MSNDYKTKENSFRHSLNSLKNSDYIKEPNEDIIDSINLKSLINNDINQNIQNNLLKDDEINDTSENKNQVNSKIKKQLSENLNNEEPIYIMTLELEKGKSEKLKIYADSDPYNLALEFCEVNNLDEGALNYLSEEIEKLIYRYRCKSEDSNDNREMENENNISENEENNSYDHRANSLQSYKNSIRDSKYNSNSERNNLENENENFPSNNSLRNSKENFFPYNNESGNNGYIDNFNELNNTMKNKNYNIDNIPYLVHEQITEVDEENNITIEKYKSMKTEENSKSPGDREFLDNSKIMNKSIKDEIYNDESNKINSLENTNHNNSNKFTLSDKNNNTDNNDNINIKKSTEDDLKFKNDPKNLNEYKEIVVIENTNINEIENPNGPQENEKLFTFKVSKENKELDYNLTFTNNQNQNINSENNLEINNKNSEIQFFIADSNNYNNQPCKKNNIFDNTQTRKKNSKENKELKSTNEKDNTAFYIKKSIPDKEKNNSKRSYLTEKPLSEKKSIPKSKYQPLAERSNKNKNSILDKQIIQSNKNNISKNSNSKENAKNLSQNKLSKKNLSDFYNKENNHDLNYSNNNENNSYLENKNNLNYIENELTSIKGTQSSMNDIKYDKENKNEIENKNSKIDKSEYNNLNNLNNLIKISDKNNDVSDIINNNINVTNNESSIKKNIINSSNQFSNNSPKNNYYENISEKLNVCRNVNNLDTDNNENNYKNNLQNKNKKISNFNNFNFSNFKRDNSNRKTNLNNKNRNKLSSIAKNNDRLNMLEDHKCVPLKIKFQGMNIFERLYKEAEIKRIIPKNSIKEEEYNIYIKNNRKNEESNVNYGEILYSREKIHKEEKSRKIMQIKYEQDTKDLKNHTFTPHINDYNNVSCRYKHFLENQYDYSKIKEIKLNKIRMNNNLNIEPDLFINYNTYFENNTKPMTTKNSGKPYQITEEQRSAHYMRSNLKKENLLKQENGKFSFHPEIKNNYQFDQNFSERQIYYKEISDKHIKKLNDLYASPYDVISRQPYFTPKLKSTIYNNSDENTAYKKNIFLKLYDDRLAQQNEKDKLSDKYYEEIIKNGKNIPSSETDLIYSTLKSEIFKKIFKELDVDYDDIITGNNIFKGLKKIDSEIKRIIEPLATQLKEENETLNQNEFIRAMEDLYNLLNYNDRRILINYNKKNKKSKSTNNLTPLNENFDNNLINSIYTKSNIFKSNKINESLDKQNKNKINNSFSFKPEINKKSKSLAKKHDEKLVKSINEIKPKNNYVDSDSFFKSNSTVLNTSATKLGGIKEFTFNNFKNKNILNISKINNHHSNQDQYQINQINNGNYNRF